MRPVGTNEHNGSMQSTAVFLQQRTKLIHKRSLPLPLLSFILSTLLAAAEKRRKKEEQERQHSIAEEESKKALLRNPIRPAFESESLNEEIKLVPNLESGGGFGFFGPNEYCTSRPGNCWRRLQ